MSNPLPTLGHSPETEKSSEVKSVELTQDQELLDQEPDDCTLFIGDLARNVNEKMLEQVFLEFGPVSLVDIKRDKSTSNNLGYGFVRMETRKDAAVAKEILNNTEVSGRRIRLGWAQKNTNLFVGDLDGSIDDEKLREVFSKFGEIVPEETFVKHSKYGFVRFKCRSHAEQAKREMDGVVLGSRPIRIGWGDVNTQKHSVHLQFAPEEAHKLNEVDIRERFEKYGKIARVTLPKTSLKPKGFGFVHYTDNNDGEEAAAAAISALSGTDINDVKIHCNFGKRKPSNAAVARRSRQNSLDRVHWKHPSVAAAQQQQQQMQSLSMNLNMLTLNQMHINQGWQHSMQPQGAQQPAQQGQQHTHHRHQQALFWPQPPFPMGAQHHPHHPFTAQYYYPTHPHQAYSGMDVSGLGGADEGYNTYPVGDGLPHQHASTGGKQEQPTGQDSSPPLPNGGPDAGAHPAQHLRQLQTLVPAQSAMLSAAHQQQPAGPAHRPEFMGYGGGYMPPPVHM